MLSQIKVGLQLVDVVCVEIFVFTGDFMGFRTWWCFALGW